MKVPVFLHVAIVDAFPAEADARLELDTGEAYLGRWRMPTPEQPEVHVFSDDATARDLERAGWVIT